MSADVKFRRDIWCLEFSFKPLRMIEVDVPTLGRHANLVWYLVYRVRNTGQVLKPVEGEGGVFTAELGQRRADAILPAVRARIARSRCRRQADRQKRISIA